MEMGEFGIQPNFDLGSYHQAYAQLVAREPTDIWHDVCGLWQGRGRVLYEHKGIPEDVMIPAGAKILILRHDPRPDGRPDQPVALLKYITVGYYLRRRVELRLHLLRSGGRGGASRGHRAWWLVRARGGCVEPRVSAEISTKSEVSQKHKNSHERRQD